MNDVIFDAFMSKDYLCRFEFTLKTCVWDIMNFLHIIIIVITIVVVVVVLDSGGVARIVEREKINIRRTFRYSRARFVNNLFVTL